MVEENKEEKEKTRTGKTKISEAKEAKTEAAQKKSRIGLLAGGGLLAFVVFLVFFSFSMGVFDRERLKAELGLNADTTSQAEGLQEGDTTEAYAEEESISEEADTTDSLTLTGEDSVRNWMENQKRNIQEEQVALDVQRKELELLKIELDNLLKQKKSLESERIAKLAKIYDGMKAQEIAAMMSNLDDETVVAILLRMSTRNAAKVLGILNPERAARISRQLMVQK